MAKTTHIARDRNGFEHRRASQSRVYSHTVVARPSYRAALMLAAEIDKTDRGNFAYHHDLATKGERDLGRGMVTRLDSFGRDPEVERAKHIAELAGAATAEEYATAKRDARVAKIEELKAKGYYDAFQNLGWCGRLDLAQKLAAKEGGSAYWEEVTILPATMAP